MHPWLKFFRIVNLPTAPGDVLVGAAAVACGALRQSVPAAAVSFALLPVAAACLASMALYLFGLADNDIVGAKSDGPERPIPAGEISLRAAGRARTACLLGAAVFGVAARLPAIWWGAAILLIAAILLYNRTKVCLLMGLCRGTNVACGGAALLAGNWRGAPGGAWLALVVVAAIWTISITAVTRYSEGEGSDPAKRRVVGILVGAIVYLQLAALLCACLLAPCPALRSLLLAGAVLLIALRLTKRAFPKVSAS